MKQLNRKGNGGQLAMMHLPSKSHVRGFVRSLARWVKRGMIAGTALAVAGVLALIIAVYGWDYPTELLDPDAGGPLVVEDRHGRVLARLPSADGRPGRGAWVRLDDVPAVAIATFLVSEDQDFFEHGGVDWAGVGRAAWLNLGERRFAYGGSTITMQLIRMVHSAGQPRTLRNKLEESVLAMRLERDMDKRTILEQYVNRAYFGNGAYGIEAAARLYFGKPAASLSAAEATLLAVVPRAPTAYDPLRNLESALARREHVFGLLREHEMLSAGQIERARQQALRPSLHKGDRKAPHFVDWIVSELPEQVRAHGGVVKTTLDLSLQEHLERELREHVDRLRHKGLDQAGMVVLDSQSGAIRAMIGSVDYHEDDGQLNITTWRRHPGSALKPFVYAQAIEQGDSPATIALDIRDVPSAYKASAGVREYGPARYRQALAGSYNLAAVHTLERVGISRVLTSLRRAGIGPLAGNRDDYGLRLALGSARIRLLDLAGAYSVFVRDGRAQSPLAIREVKSWTGHIWRPAPRRDRRVFSPETSWLVMDMLADAQARREVFGYELPIDLSHPIAVKTGTARGFADTVAIGVTSEVTVAAWAGRFDGVPTHGLVAMESAAPLVRAGFLAVAPGHAMTLPQRPAAIEDAYVCADSGMKPGPACPHHKLEHFGPGTVPNHLCDWHVPGEVDIRYPAAARAWAHRQATRGARHLATSR